MSRGQTLRALLNERLAAAAEDIFVLFERTIAEYEEELHRSKEEKQRKQRLLDKVLYPRIKLVRGNFHDPWTSPDPCLNQEITETPQIKDDPEEQSVKPEEQQLPVPVPESSVVCVKTKVSSLLQLRQNEQLEKTQGEDISSELRFHSETEGHTEHSSDNDGNREPFSRSAAQVETEIDGDHHNQVQTRDIITKLSLKNKSAPETTVHSEHMSGAHGGAADRKKKHQGSVCNKGFIFKSHLQKHIRLHTGETPYSCSIREKTMIQKDHLSVHKSTHTGERPYSCLCCEKTFSKKVHLDRHKRTHTGERPYSCSSCNKCFISRPCLKRHIMTHTGERPYSCSSCNKRFSQLATLKQHSRTHTGEKPYRCSICEKTFNQKSHLNTHKRTHTGERPYSCPSCEKTFTKKTHLDRHKRTHTGEKPYSCSSCNKCFTSRPCLKRHTRTHTGDRPYSCPSCEKSFIQKAHLDRHKRIHKGI